MTVTPVRPALSRVRTERPSVSPNMDKRPAAATARVRQLRDKIQALQAELVFQQGRPLEFPADLDDRYRRAAVVKSINEALAFAGIKAEVDTIDCNEYPCIACATLPKLYADVPDVNRDLTMLKKAARSPSVEPYKDAEKAAIVVTRTDNEKGQQPSHATTFCQSFFAKPADARQTPEMKKRIRFRMKDLVPSDEGG